MKYSNYQTFFYSFLLKTFTTERACRAHRKEHRRNTTNGTTITRITK